MRKEQFRQSCYYCGNPRSSDEHAPPQQLFKGFSCNKIIVPSCNKHNTEKSGSDTAVIKGMLISLDVIKDKYPPKGDALKAILTTEKQFPQVKRQIMNINKIKDEPPLTYFQPSIKVTDWMRQLTAALIYNAIKKYDPENQFDGAIVFCPTWVEGASDIGLPEIIGLLKVQKRQEDNLQNLNWKLGWPSGKVNYPSGIYCFELCFDFIEDVVFRHRFFDSLVWYVGIKVSKETRKEIIRKVEMNTNS